MEKIEIISECTSEGLVYINPLAIASVLSNFTNYGKHETQTVTLLNGQQYTVSCFDCLPSPVDRLSDALEALSAAATALPNIVNAVDAGLTNVAAKVQDLEVA